MFLALQNLGLVYYFYPCYFVFLVQLIHFLFFFFFQFHGVQGRLAIILYPYVFLIIFYIIAKLLENEFLRYKNKIEEENDTLLLTQKVAKVGDYGQNSKREKL